MSEVSGEPTCTVLGNEARSSSLLPTPSPNAAVELPGSESGIRSGESGGGPLGEGSGLSIHLHVTYLVQLSSSMSVRLPPSAGKQRKTTV